MKKLISLIIILSLTPSANLLAQSNQPWSEGTAFTLPQGRFEAGLFRPLRWGHNETTEWAVHPIIGLLMPNFQVKINRSATDQGATAARITIVIPTYLMRMGQRDGTGGVLAKESSIPMYPLLVAVRGEMLHSKQLAEDKIFTYKYGVALALGADKPDDRLLIELPSIYPRTLLYHNTLQINTGADLTDNLSGKWYYWVDADIFITPLSDHLFAAEHKFLLSRRGSARRQFSFGYKLTGADYPFGFEWHIIPLIDFQFAFEKK